MMVRPQSIVRYERFYLSSVLLGLIASALSWQTRAAALDANPLLAAKTWILWATLIVGVAISLLLWQFTARAPSIVAKWIVTIFAAFAAIGIVFLLFQLVTGRVEFGISGVIMLVVDILYIIAATLLFRPDSTRWFGEIPVGQEPFA